MANVCKGLVWEIDTEGFLLDSVIRIKKAIFYPNNTGDQITFTYWGPQSANVTARATQIGKTVSVTSTTTITSTGNFEAAEAVVNDIIEIYASTASNLGHWQIGTVSSDNAIIVDIGLGGWGRAGGALTNDTSKVYSWRTWAPTVAFKVTPDSTPSKAPIQFDFDMIRGQRFPNLAVHTISGGATAVLYIA